MGPTGRDINRLPWLEYLRLLWGWASVGLQVLCKGEQGARDRSQGPVPHAVRKTGHIRLGHIHELVAAVLSRGLAILPDVGVT